MKTLSFYVFLILLIFNFSGCKPKTPISQETNKIKVMTTLFPLYDFTKAIGGDMVEVKLLLPPGVESHSYEPKPDDLIRINNSHMLVYTGIFMEKWIQNIIKENKGRPLLIDASKDVKFIKSSIKDSHDSKHDHDHKIDPHIWLDFDNVKLIIKNITEGLISLSPENKAVFLKNMNDYLIKIDELDKKYKNTLSTCRSRNIIFGGHNTFSYLAARYDLKFIPFYKGLEPDEEPSPKHIIKIVDTIKKQGIKAIFYEEIENSKVASVIASETNVKLLKVSSAHNVTRQDIDMNVSFLEIMEKNLSAFKEGLECY